MTDTRTGGRDQPAQPIRILLADDHAVVRRGIREFLDADARLRVVAEAGGGEQALALAQQHRPDVLVLDIQMPGKTGIEVTRELRAAEAAAGILILTAYDDEPYIVSALQAGANGYVLKTAEPEELVDAVLSVREGRSVLDQQLAARVVRHVTQARGHPDDAPPAEALSAREVEVLRLVARGFTNKAIAVQLGISDRTVQGHLANVFGKLGAQSRTDAVMIGLRRGLITPQ